MITRTSRRGALKLIGLGGLGTALAPSFLVQACREAAESAGTDYAFQVLDETQAATLKAIQDAILPQTTDAAGAIIPSASDVGSVEFFDTYLAHGYEAADRERMLYRLDKFAELLEEEEGVPVAEATPEQIGAMLDRYYMEYEAPEAADNTMEIEGNIVERQSSDPEVLAAQREARLKREASEDADLEEGAIATSEELGTHTQVEESVLYADDPTELNGLLTGLRYLTLESYFQSEYVGENVLNYLEVPGEYVGVVPMSEIPNGRAWSL